MSKIYLILMMKASMMKKPVQQTGERNIDSLWQEEIKQQAAVKSS